MVKQWSYVVTGGRSPASTTRDNEEPQNRAAQRNTGETTAARRDGAQQGDCQRSKGRVQQTPGERTADKNLGAPLPGTVPSRIGAVTREGRHWEKRRTSKGARNEETCCGETVRRSPKYSRRERWDKWGAEKTSEPSAVQRGGSWGHRLEWTSELQIQRGRGQPLTGQTNGRQRSRTATARGQRENGQRLESPWLRGCCEVLSDSDVPGQPAKGFTLVLSREDHVSSWVPLTWKVSWELLQLWAHSCMALGMSGRAKPTFIFMMANSPVHRQMEPLSTCSNRIAFLLVRISLPRQLWRHCKIMSRTTTRFGACTS